MSNATDLKTLRTPGHFHHSDVEWWSECKIYSLMDIRICVRPGQIMKLLGFCECNDNAPFDVYLGVSSCVRTRAFVRSRACMHIWFTVDQSNTEKVL